MRILIADFSGHPFQVQLSRALAGRGHEVLHLFCSSSETPKGDLERKASDPPGFNIRGVSLGEAVDKTNFVKRRRQEINAGKKFAEVIHEFVPDVGIFSNQPIDTLAYSIPALQSVGAKFVFWLQDLLGEAALRVLSARLGLPGRLVGHYYSGRESRFLRRADHIIAISDDFRPILEGRLGLPEDKVTVIENWAPISDIPILDRNNAWACDNLPADKCRIIYSGTLGFKQDPEALLRIAEAVNCEVIIFSEGAAAKAVSDQAKARALDNVSVRDWLPFHDLPKALAGADILVVLLEPDAGLFSVPSKVLTYMCVGRPILGLIDGANLAAKTIQRNGAGLIFQPGDYDGIVEGAQRLVNDPTVSLQYGVSARRYAETAFDIEIIVDRFEAILGEI